MGVTPCYIIQVHTNVIGVGIKELFYSPSVVWLLYNTTRFRRWLYT